MKITTYLTLFSALSFLFFGLACIATSQMKTEFLRYGLAPYRSIVGILQLIGAIGLALGYFYEPMLHAAAAVGLSILMLLGFMVRIRIRDSFLKSIPSLIYAVLNAYIFMDVIGIV